MAAFFDSEVLSQPTIISHAENFQSSPWGDFFLSIVPTPSVELERIKQSSEGLKGVIRKMLREKTNQLRSLEMIDAIEHLGVAYHFESEINESLKIIHKERLHESNDVNTAALSFRLLRQRRFPVTSDVFCKFIDKNGDLAPTNLKHDAKALLSLYNASYLGIPGETILERASNFARTHLELLMSTLESSLAKMVSRDLETPRFRRMERLEACEYLSNYGNEKNRCEDLLEFAKFDFRFVRSIHLEELRNLTLWRKSMDLAKKFPFARDRLVELYFWVIGIYFEPHYSRARIMTTKVLVLTSILDDIYDQYGTYEELQLLTETIERWEVLGIDVLPMYLQCFWMNLYKTFQEIEDELAIEKNSFRVGFLKEEMKKLSHAYFVERQWIKEHYVPNVEDHLRVSLRSSGYSMLYCCSLVGMHEMIPHDVFYWISELPTIVKASCIISRVMNDITSDEHEQNENHGATIIQSYIKEHKCIEEEARSKLKGMVEDAWRTMNEESLLHNNLSSYLLRPVINLARVIELFYKDKDNYSYPFSSMRDNIKLVMVEPINITSS